MRRKSNGRGEEMSLKKGRVRHSAVVVALSLGAFQALSMIGATSASATVSTVCSFTGGTLTLGLDANTGTFISQDVAKNILVDGALTSSFAGTPCATAHEAHVGTVTSIHITD